MKINFPNRIATLKAFTLLEVLMVVVIIGILATVAMGPITAAQKRSRDGQRKTHLNLMAQGIELYYASNRSYPGSPGCNTPSGITSLSGDPWIAGGLEKYIPLVANSKSASGVPKDPKNTGNYYYTYSCAPSGGTTIKLTARLENTRDPEIDPVSKLYEVKR
jgi:prepilin-type N-terminal cleavage/methylation domain-containing protein